MFVEEELSCAGLYCALTAGIGWAGGLVGLTLYLDYMNLAKASAEQFLNKTFNNQTACADDYGYIALNYTQDFLCGSKGDPKSSFKMLPQYCYDVIEKYCYRHRSLSVKTTDVIVLSIITASLVAFPIVATCCAKAFCRAAERSSLEENLLSDRDRESQLEIAEQEPRRSWCCC